VGSIKIGRGGEGTIEELEELKGLGEELLVLLAKDYEKHAYHSLV